MNFTKKQLKILTEKYNDGTKKIPLYVDFDGTLVNSTKRLTQMLNKKFNMNKIWWKINKYDCSDVFPELTLSQVCEPFSKKEFFNHKLKKKMFAERTLCKLEKYFDIYIVTLGTEDNLKHKEEWCKLNFKFNHTFIGLKDFSKKKSTIDMSKGIMIDDHIEMLRSCNARCKFLIKGFFQREWNNSNDDDFINNMYFGISENWLNIDRCLKTIIMMNAEDDF